MSTTNSLISDSLVSVILPVYNRLSFLPTAIAAIVSQKHTNWELIIIDDGSTDGTQDRIKELVESIRQPVQFIRQENQGAYGARNTGLDHSTGRYIAFYDSDDVWLPHHLANCVVALDKHTKVDWVFAACEIIDMNTNRVLSKSTFHLNGSANKFLHLTNDKHDDLAIITDNTAPSCQIQHGLYCGLQNSVIRKQLFDTFRFEWESRNEAEDQIFAIKMLSRNKTLAYFDNVHVRYYIHDSNSSSAGSDVDLTRQERVTSKAIAGFENLLETEPLDLPSRRALKKRISEEYFWKLGYAILWMKLRDRPKAFQNMKQGIRYSPTDIRMLKTYAICKLRSLLTKAFKHHPAA